MLRLDATDLPAALAQAQAALLAEPPGAEHVWLVPSGVHDVGAMSVGADDRSLTLTALDPTAPPTLRLAAAGSDALEVRGSRAAVVTLRVQADVEDGAALAVRGADVHVRDVVAEVRGRACAAVVVQGTATAEVLESRVPVADATVGDASGLLVDAPTVCLHHVDVDAVTARDRARGVRVAAVGAGAPGRASVSRVRVGSAVGADATGIEVVAGATVAPDPSAGIAPTDALTLVDATVDEVRARADEGTAVAVRVGSAGSAQVRGVTTSGARGTRAVGIETVVGAQAEIVGATVRAVAGGAGGAAGIALQAGASPEPLVVDDVHVESVFAPDHADLVRGVDVSAVVDELAPWLADETDAGPVRVTGSVLRRVSGTALAVDADLRDVEVRGVEAVTAARAGSVRGERVVVSESTWHRTATGLAVGPATLTLVDSLLTGTATAPALGLDAETEVELVAAAFTDVPDPTLRLAPLPAGLPYVEPGPPGVPAALAQGRFVPEAAIDLRLRTPELHDLAVGTPADPPGRPRQVGAQPPAAPAPCDLRDPLAVPAVPAPVPVPYGPVVDRTSKDARGLLSVMRARAATVMPGWVPQDAADLTTTLLELVAHRLDRVAYEQDAALTEAYLLHARRRRSVEEHARLVDYRPDPGLTATTMLHLDVHDVAALGGTPFVLGAGTLVVNPDATQDPVIVSTEEDLTWHASLADVRLLDDVPVGATTARLVGDLLDLVPGRWLVIAPDDPRAPAHVVRVTLLETGTDETLVHWDPRRPTATAYGAATTRVLANVVPAQHGVGLPYETRPGLVDPDLAEQLAAVAAELDLVVEPAVDALVEVPLPLTAVSRVAPGWPFPAEPPRTGATAVTVEVDGEPWRAVDDVATEPGEVFALVPDEADGTTVVLGQPGTLPARPLRVVLTARLGAGTAGNVAAHTLSSLVALGPGTSPLPAGTGLDAVRAAVSLDNPVPGVGGRDPEPLDLVRRRAPWAARSPVTAVTVDDHARLLEELPEVAAARARVLELGERRLVRATLLLTDEDTLVGAASGTATAADVDPVRDAERLRRWSLARRRLEEVRLLGVDVQLVPPTFVPVDLDLVVDAHDWAPTEQVHRDVVAALEDDGGLFDPDTLGLGGDVHVDSVLRRALAVTGVAAAHVRRLRRAYAGATEHAVDGTLPVGDDEVAVLRRPYGDGPAGLLTVEVCGGRG